MDEELARRFLTALRAEYVEKQEGADPWTPSAPCDDSTLAVA